MDCPAKDIINIERLPNYVMFRVYCEGVNPLALKLVGRRVNLKEFRDALRALKITVQDVEEVTTETWSDATKTQLPDLSDVHTQQMILKLLYSEEFHEFSQQLNDLLNAMESKTHLA
jgi:hypothetical protein